MWAGNSQCCGLTWNLSFKWVFHGEILVEFVFICVHNHLQWLSKPNSLTNIIPWDNNGILTAGIQKDPLDPFCWWEQNTNNFLFFMLCVLKVGYWCDYWCQFESLWFSSSKINPEMILVDDKTIDKTFLMMFLWENSVAWEPWEHFFEFWGGFSCVKVHSEMALVGIDERSQK